MAIVKVKYMEILERQIAVNVSDNLTIEKQLEQAIDIGRQMYRDEKVVLGSDDLTVNEIQAVRNEFSTEFEQI
ncbi:MAG: hypothetical protein Q611_LSC00245G0002 [Leuconostoc sp. DORA_2]|jgi:hypothetical protein|uniref:hypothetical protein n=1 Tax=Leuconostoc TaxID=1243 RepID=UPI000246579C|nr:MULTISPECIES: hypothetical protein [Leuconostoc]ETI99658.1 MAG: hypothetical protein Q611_LSC00245G0002 [Leuconostoc sp. DORA_2]MBA5937969.1 hypothetical protein [Leuconostoc citreum]MCT3054733.1 hypothetical protein [Leuconostoc citreum]MCT3062939.1 hypothetical protein [Leuconostoc citreum]MCT3073482.1 hypothetical protein [Leuconostoc citreum]